MCTAEVALAAHALAVRAVLTAVQTTEPRCVTLRDRVLVNEMFDEIFTLGNAELPAAYFETFAYDAVFPAEGTAAVLTKGDSLRLALEEPCFDLAGRLYAHTHGSIIDNLTRTSINN